jgi:dTDP-4-amino-4,6-dideoxygalactose transaminase
MRGAKPAFADVDRNSQNITADTIKKVITSRTRAIIVVHLAGWPCEMDTIMALAKKNGLAVIEDCAQASGAFYKGRPIGSIGDVAAFSFCQDKIMTTGGEGGMVVTNNKDIWSKIWSYKDHGKGYDAVYGNNDLKPGPSFKWLHESFGTNWRMTGMQAAIGRVQLRKLPGWIERRRQNADILTKAFLNVSALRVTTPPDYILHSYYKYYVFLKPEILKTGWNRERIIIAINAEGIPCFTGSCSEMYLEKAFDAGCMRPEKRLPVAEELGETSLMFLVHPTLTKKDMMSVASILREGEKLYEELITVGEDILPTVHEKVMVLRSNNCFNSAKNPQEARKHLYHELDELAKIAARHDAKGIKIKLKEIVPEYTPQENESVL